MKCTYYQCSNQKCKFRFPTYEQQVWELSCPVCGSPVILIETHEIQSEPKSRNDVQINIHLEAFLDNIRSALNVGSMFRTADGFGVRHIYLSGISPTPNLKNVTKSSLGAERNIPWTYIQNGVEKILLLKEHKKVIVAIEEHKKAENIFSIDFSRLDSPMVIVVGNENCGIDPGILAMSDLILRIPMLGIKKSLNVAVAFGIALSVIQNNQMNRFNSYI